VEVKAGQSIDVSYGPRVRWINAAVTLGVVLGFGALIYMLVALDALGGARGVMLMMLLWQALGAALAATIVVVGTVYQCVRRQPLAIATSRVPRLIAAITGGGIAGASLIVTTIVATNEMSVLMGAGLALTILAVYGNAAPWRPRYAALGLLASIAIFVLPREAGWFSLTAHKTHTESKWRDEKNESCGGTNWDGRIEVASLARSVDLRPSLTGNVGELVPAAEPQHESGTKYGVAVVKVTGDVRVGWLPCLVPLHKRVHIETELDVTLHVRSYGNARFTRPGPPPFADCSATARVQLTIDHVVNGVASCRNVREQLAAKVAKQLEDSAHKLAGLNQR
jgi:hypothetical protein